MLTGIDHLVIVVHDLDHAAKDYETLGFTVVPGGKHPGVGSHNALIAFADGSYLELIAFYREAIDHRWWNPLQQGERLVDYCMQTDDLPGDTKKLRDAGAAIKDPFPLSRTRPDGYELKWILSLPTGSHRGVAPILIRDVTPRHERIPQNFKHKNGAAGIRKLTIATGELSAVERWYAAVLGQTGTAITDESIGAQGRRYKAGPHDLEFLLPREANSPLVNWMRMFGSSPYAATLHGDFTSSEVLDSRLTHGANLTFGR